MKIPLGNFGTTTPGRVSPGTAGGDFGQGVGQAVQRLGQTITGVMDQREQEKNALARAKAVNDVYRHETEVMGVIDEIQTKGRNGELKYQDYENYFQNRVGAIRRPQTDGLDPATVEQFDGLVTRNVARDLQTVKGLSETAEQHEYADQFEQAMDTIGKQAQFPGADVAVINGKYGIAGEMGKRAKLNPAYISKRIQDAQDRNWFDSVNNKAMQYQAANNVEALQQMKHDLTAEDGAYVGVMDTSKRNTLLSGVISGIKNIEYRQKTEAAQREAKAQSALSAFANVHARGGTPSPALTKFTESAVNGTAVEPAFREMLQITTELQQTSGDPVEQFIAAQQELIDTKKSANSEAEIIRAEKKVMQAKGAVELMQNNPVKYDAARSGTMPKSLDPVKLMTDYGRAEMQEELAQRSVRISAMQNLYGDVVKMRPMQPEEATQWSAVLNRSPHKERGEMIAFLRNSLPDDKAYFGLMQQISPDSPVTRHAGFVAARQASVVIENGFVRDTTQDTGDISGLMLLGEDLLNPSKTIESANGNAKAFPMPKQDEFDRKFSEEVGGVFGGNPTARSNAYLSVRAYYAGAASLQDKYDGELDSKLLKKAVRATLGEVVDFNSKGSVLAPLGMDSASFTTKAREVINSTLTDTGMPETYARYAFGLRNVQGGYVITKPDGTELVDNDGSALIVQVKP